MFPAKREITTSKRRLTQSLSCTTNPAGRGAQPFSAPPFATFQGVRALGMELIFPQAKEGNSEIPAGPAQMRDSAVGT